MVRRRHEKRGSVRRLEMKCFVGSLLAWGMRPWEGGTLSILLCYISSSFVLLLPDLSLSLRPFHSLFSFSYTPEEESEGEGGKKMVPVVWSSCSGERRFVDRLHEKNRREIEIWLTQRSKRNQTMKHSWTHSCLSTFFRADSLPRSFFLSSLSPKPLPICFVRPNSKRPMWMRPQIQGSEGSGVFCPCPLFLKTNMFLDLQYFHRTLSQLRRVH